jgi:hypothetical protein
MNQNTNQPKPYQTPHLETHQFLVVTGISIPIGSNGADPWGDFLEAPTDFLETGEQ